MSRLQDIISVHTAPVCTSALERKPLGQRPALQLSMQVCPSGHTGGVTPWSYSLETWVILSVIKGIVLENV